MIDLVAGYAAGYSRVEVRPFLKSLRDSGYKGAILLFANGGAAVEACQWEVDVRPVPKSKIEVHSARFICLEEIIRETRCEGILLTDTRDLIFQKDPSTLPSQGLHAFEEDGSMTLGSCPYNSMWLQLGYGAEALAEMAHFSISCVGTVCGDYQSIAHYLESLCTEIKRIQPRTRKPQDQAAHNYLVRKVLSNRMWGNEEGEVYTVGYLPRGSVKVVDGKIVNEDGHVPTVIHQWDRHANLKDFVENAYVY